MQKIVAILFILILSIQTNAQDAHISLFGGAANYAGDLQTKRFTLDQSIFTIGIWGSYEYSN